MSNIARIDRITGRYRPADGDSSDEALLALVARGDKPAMRALFGRFNVRVFRFLVRLVKNDALAEELLNDVFIAVWRHAGQFRARSRFRLGSWRSPAKRRSQSSVDAPRRNWTRWRSDRSKIRPMILRPRSGGSKETS